MDLMTRKILSHLVLDAGCDIEAVARAAGCTPQVAEDRIRRLQDEGIVRGFRAQVDLARVGVHHEALVVGVPSHATEPALLQRIAQQPDVTRVFTLASQASVAFHIHGTDPDALERRAAELAAEAGLRSHRCTLVVSSIEGGAQVPQLVTA